jgi:putative peptidoglycan lipid II flippase
MIKKIFLSQSKTITGAAIILGTASFISRFIGVIRDRIFTHYFGAGEILDSYYAAFRIPDLVYNLVVIGAITAGFVPVFVELMTQNKEEAWRVANSVLNILGSALFAVCSILFIFTPQLIRIIVPGFTEAQLHTTIILTRIMFLSPILLGISGIVSGILQSFRSFFVFAITPITYNLGIIFGAVVLVPILGTLGLAYGVVIGACAHLLVQLPALYKNGFHYQRLFLWKNPYVRKIGAMLIPRTLSLATSQINVMAMTFMASLIGPGSVTIFNLADNLQYFPIGIIGISFGAAALPAFSQAVAENDITRLVERFALTIRQILFLIIPTTILFLLLRAQIVRVVLGSGQFDWIATIRTADTLAFFALSMFAGALLPTISRCFFALKDTLTPFIVGLVATIINIILSWQFKNFFGVPGLAFGFSIATILQLSLMWILLHKKIGQIGETGMLHSLYKISIAALIMGITIQYLKTPVSTIVDMTKFWGIFLQGFISGLMGMLSYCIICYLLKVTEFIILIDSIKQKYVKLKNANYGIHIETKN